MFKEVAPPGWSGTVAAMRQKHPEIKNPYALAWYMKNKGSKSHYQPQPKNDSRSNKPAVKKEGKNFKEWLASRSDNS